jgi:hypothetical protein
VGIGQQGGLGRRRRRRRRRKKRVRKKSRPGYFSNSSNNPLDVRENCNRRNN